MIHPLTSSAGRNDIYVAMRSVKFREQTGVGCSDGQSDTIFPLKFRDFKTSLKEVEDRFPKKFSDLVIIEEFAPIAKEADELPKERNLMLHSVWLTSSDPDKTFVRLKGDEDEPEIDFDVPTVERSVDCITEFAVEPATSSAPRFFGSPSFQQHCTTRSLLAGKPSPRAARTSAD
jgi:hypothetical protein